MATPEEAVGELLATKSRRVEFTPEAIEDTQARLEELFALCKQQAGKVQLRKVSPGTWDFHCEETTPPVSVDTVLITTTRRFLFPPDPDQSLAVIQDVQSFVQRCMAAHEKDEASDTPRISTGKTRGPWPPDAPSDQQEIVEGIDITCVLSREIIEQIARGTEGE